MLSRFRKVYESQTGEENLIMGQSIDLYTFNMKRTLIKFGIKGINDLSCFVSNSPTTVMYVGIFLNVGCKDDLYCT